MAKSNNRPKYDGIEFRSKTEVEFYKLLKKAKKDGNIYDFEYEPEASIILDEYIDFREKKIAKIEHLIDFKIWKNENEFIYVDTKGGAFHETDAKIKRKMFEQKNPNVEYYWVSKLPKYMGDCFIESTPYYDFFTKLRNKYAKEFPNEKKKHWSKREFIFDYRVWDKYFEFEDVLGLFYVWKSTKRINKKKIKG